VKSIGLPSWIERALGRQPRPVPPYVFAVRRRELRFAAFSRPEASGSGLELAEFHSLPLAEGVFGLGPLGVPAGDAESLADSVRALVARAARPVREASVVLPDAWVRSMVIELGDLPADPQARLEVLRFRIKRMVPYRVEDLRIEAVPIGAIGAVGAGGASGATGASGASERRGPSGSLAAVESPGAPAVSGGMEPGGMEPGATAHCLVTLANAAVCTMIEDGFARRGIRIGQLSGATLATLQAVNRGALAAGLFGLALVDADGFSLALVRAGVPVVWRQKSFSEGLSDADRARLLTSELRLTRTLLSERFAGEALTALYLAAPRAVEPFWLQVLGQGLDCQPTRLAREHLALSGEGFGDAFTELAPLAGAASREVA
jgi:hypothetical protein